MTLRPSKKSPHNSDISVLPEVLGGMHPVSKRLKTILQQTVFTVGCLLSTDSTLAILPQHATDSGSNIFFTGPENVRAIYGK